MPRETAIANSFNNVFQAVKKYCENEPCDDDDTIFENIALDANVSLFRMQYYLDILQNLGLIHYSFDTNSISLTAFGKRQKGLFTE